MNLADVHTVDLLAKMSASAHIAANGGLDESRRAHERLTEYSREYLRRRALASTKAGQGI